MSLDPRPRQTPDLFASEGGGSLVAGISRDIVRIHSRYYGRGPTKAKTVWDRDVIACILEEVFTKSEQLLVNAGHFEAVRSHRVAFQDEVEPLFRAVVEGTTGFAVESFLSQVSLDGVASEIFVLGEPLEPTLQDPIR